MIQSSRYHRLMVYVKRKNLLPLCYSNKFTQAHKVLDFYSCGLMKEKISYKIVTSFEICDPSFFTSFRDSIMHVRSVVFDHLFSFYQHKPFCDKGKFVCLFVTECYIESRNKSNSLEDSTILIELMNFILNYLFLAGLDMFFQTPSFFQLKEPDRHFQEKENHMDVLVKAPLCSLFEVN